MKISKFNIILSILLLFGCSNENTKLEKKEETKSQVREEQVSKQETDRAVFEDLPELPNSIN
ncbi:hypothetical protein [Bacillus testis]|uniref:hypothetical protein n=1 Tax=Bacillus testis TaxID=1622072 RepID=UPI00067ED841|nr:hypothetical protein [Bacillus testis]